LNAVIFILLAVNVAHAVFVGVLASTGSEITGAEGAAIAAATSLAVAADLSAVVWAGRSSRG
jgi:hypothetical protein